MNKLTAHIEQLEQQLLQLLAQSNEQKNKLQKLQQENEELKHKIQQPKLANRQNHSISQGFTEAQENPSTAMLSHYIATIDACIAFLEDFNHGRTSNQN